MTALRWFAFTTAPSREFGALQELNQFAAETRLPVGLKDVKKPNGGFRKRSWPLLVGYAFAGFRGAGDLEEALAMLVRAREAERKTATRRVVATTTGKPLELLADKHGRAWYEAMDYSTVELPGGEARPLGWGPTDTVRITEGPFAGHIAPVARVAGERASVVVELFQSLYEVDISVRQAVLHKSAKRAPAFEIGSAVDVLVGPFAGFVGVVDAIAEDGTLGVTTTIFGRETPVTLSPDQVKLRKRSA